jgi:hypothetical protein
MKPKRSRILRCSIELANWAACYSRKIRDLLAVANQWNRKGEEYPGLFFGHPLQLTIGQAVRDLELAAKVLEPQDVRNLVEYLPL